MELYSSDRPDVVPQYVREIEAHIAAYMADGLRERLLAAAICKCADCQAQLRAFNVWCFDFTSSAKEASVESGEWFNDWAQDRTQYRIKRSK